MTTEEMRQFIIDNLEDESFKERLAVTPIEDIHITYRPIGYAACFPDIYIPPVTIKSVDHQNANVWSIDLPQGHPITKKIEEDRNRNND